MDRVKDKKLVGEVLIEATFVPREPNEQTAIYSDDPFLQNLSITDIRLYLTQFQSEGFIKLIREYRLDDGSIKFVFEPVHMNPLLEYVEFPTHKESDGRSNYFITFNDDRRILLNGTIELAKPDFEGVNEVTFKFLYDHPNQTFTKEFLESKTKKKIGSFDKMADNLGFRRGLKAAFFDMKVDTIRFKNPITL